MFRFNIDVIVLNSKYNSMRLFQKSYPRTGETVNLADLPAVNPSNLRDQSCFI